MTASGLSREQQEQLRRKRFDTLHKHVVAQHLRNGFQGRWTRRDWAHTSVFATMAALVGAIVPGLDQMPGDKAIGQAQYASFALPLPKLSANQSIHADGKVVIRREKGQSVDQLLEQLQLSRNDARALRRFAEVRDRLNALRTGDSAAFEFAKGTLRGVTFPQADGSTLAYAFAGKTLKRDTIAADVDRRLVVLSGQVGDSLIDSAHEQGLNDEQIRTLTDEIFKYDVDIDQDVASTDRFSAVVERTFRNGELVDTSPVLAATLTTGNTLHSGYRFEQNGKAEYFTADGRPLKKEFIRTPIPYARLSSRFGGRRHPVLGVMRMHKGLDYAAGTGTPIMAAGDARVVSAGRNGGYGNAVVLDHGRGITTLYGHMSRIARIRPGQRVEQGTVIGYVGSTGLSTGPHLHYEFRVNGVHRNPLTVTKNAPAPLQGAQLQSFLAYAAGSLQKIRSVEDVIYVDKSPAARQLQQQLQDTKAGRKPTVASKAPTIKVASR